jgi:hypothetical protein
MKISTLSRPDFARTRRPAAGALVPGVSGSAQQHRVVVVGYDRRACGFRVLAGTRSPAAALANPDLPARLQANAPLNAADPATFYGGDHPDYPTLDAAQK